jgi:hypothetical protein
MQDCPLPQILRWSGGWRHFYLVSYQAEYFEAIPGMPKAQPMSLVGTVCVEQRLFEPSESDHSPVFKVFMMEIRLNPRNSVLARLGLTNIDKELELAAQKISGITTPFRTSCS